MANDRPTLKDIAEKTGVSIATVSRALHNDARVAKSTRQLVLRAAHKMDFPVLSFSQNKQLGQIAVHVLDSDWGVFFDATLRELTLQGIERNLEVVIHPAQKRYEAPAVGLARVANMADGVAVLGTWDSLSPADIDLLAEVPVPVVLINRYGGDYASAVKLDDYGTGMKVANYLIGLGHKRIAYLRGRVSSSAMADRLRGFRTSLEQKGLFYPELITEPFTGSTIEWACRCVDYLLNLAEPPTAIWTCNDIAASAVIVSMKTRGLRVPEDISVVGHDHMPQVKDIGLTTCDFRLSELGYHVANLAEGFVRGTLRSNCHISIMPELIEGTSSGPAPVHPWQNVLMR